MSRHTICAAAGQRLVVQPSTTSPGCLSLQLLGADRAVKASVTLDVHAAQVFADALMVGALRLEGDEKALCGWCARAEIANEKKCGMCEVNAVQAQGNPKILDCDANNNGRGMRWVEKRVAA